MGESTIHIPTIMYNLYGHKRDLREIDLIEHGINLTTASRAVAIKNKTKEPVLSRYQRYTQETQDWDTPDGLRIDTKSITIAIDISKAEEEKSVFQV